MRRCHALIPVFFLLFFGALSSLRGDVGEALKAKLQAVLDQEMERHDVRGVSAAVVFPDGTRWVGTSGVSHGAVPMDPSMLFGIGSVTKNFVAALTLNLVEEGVLSLDDAVADHLPPFEHVDDGITIRQLLNHTSGLYNFFDSDAVWDALEEDRDRVWTPEEILAYLDKPYFRPGEGFRYSNTNYLLVGMIIEEVSSSTLSAELGHRFFGPLGIEAGFFDPGETPNRMAHVSETTPSLAMPTWI